MDDSFQFIIESPQHNQGHKKRPRLVTSCDNCRLKKIKCLQPSPEAKCDACKASKIPCRFRDRERYFAERSRAIAGPASPSGSSSAYMNDDQREQTPSMEPYSPSGVVVPEGEHNVRYQPYSPDPRRSFESSRHAPSSSASQIHSARDPIGYPYMPSNTGPMIPHPRSQHSRPMSLFDPDHPQRPNALLMQHFIQVFFENLGKDFSFINYEAVWTDFWAHRLSPMLANAIAAMASRYTDNPDLHARGLLPVSDAYMDMAKSIYESSGRQISLDTLNALMLIAWSEYRNARIPSFRGLVQLAMNMAMDLGLNQQPQMSPTNDRDEMRRHATYSNVVMLSMTAQQVR